MSGTIILKNGLMAAVCVAGLTLTACASSNGAYGHSNSRYGSVYDYESGGNCNAGPCGAAVAAPVVASRYGSAETVIGGQAVSPGVVYADCSVVGGMNCNQPAPMYTQQPAPVYTPAPTYAQTAPSYGAPVACPAGTTPNGDGTCMESSMPYGGSPPSMRQTQAYSGSPPSMSQSYSAQSYGGETAPCPSGTTPNGDGTCMEGGGGSIAYSGSPPSMSQSYSATTSQSYSGEMADCPAGTTPNGDGTCMEGTGSTGTVEIYGNSGGYQQTPTYNPPVDYLPIRK